jgi:hypothetical protein
MGSRDTGAKAPLCPRSSENEKKGATHGALSERPFLGFADVRCHTSGTIVASTPQFETQKA